MLTAERNAKFHSSQTAPGQHTAENATQNEDHHADIRHCRFDMCLDLSSSLSGFSESVVVYSPTMQKHSGELIEPGS